MLTLSRNQTKAELGQFMTPPAIAKFMASMFPSSNLRQCRLLDAGAGTGALSRAFFDRWVSGDLGFGEISLTAYEIDNSLCTILERNLAQCTGITRRIVQGDFIELTSSRDLFQPDQPTEYTHAILNPPYKKIPSNSKHRLALRNMGIETVNLYSAFVALSIAQSAPSGQIVAIIPRSFCNGPYYRPFRDYILLHTAIRHIHLFESRSAAFKNDDVLQENVIIRLERGAPQGPVKITTSTDHTFADLKSYEHPFSRIVYINDAEHFIRIPSSAQTSMIEQQSDVLHTLVDLGIRVSTGPVVDYRLKEHLRSIPDESCVPLVYPAHFDGMRVSWPMHGGKKPNAIQRNSETEKWLYPNGHYCLVRRLSSKEEKRRIVATLFEPAAVGSANILGFDNHLNVYHENGHGLPELLAAGLAVYLNSNVVDQCFRGFNGHTQVNATDLRMMKYPSRETLIELGKWATTLDTIGQSLIDERVKGIL